MFQLLCSWYSHTKCFGECKSIHKYNIVFIKTMWVKFWIISLNHLIKWYLRALRPTGSIKYSGSFEIFTWRTLQWCHFYNTLSLIPGSHSSSFIPDVEYPRLLDFTAFLNKGKKTLEGRQGKEKQKMRHKYKPLICLSITLISFLIFKDHSLTLKKESESYLKFQF